MAVSLKTTLAYHKAEVSKQSLQGLAACNTPQNANHLSSWASKQEKHAISSSISGQYTQCSGTTLNTYGNVTTKYSDDTSNVENNKLISSVTDLNACPRICRVNGKTSGLSYYAYVDIAPSSDLYVVIVKTSKQDPSRRIYTCVPIYAGRKESMDTNTGSYICAIYGLYNYNITSPTANHNQKQVKIGTVLYGIYLIP